MKELISQWELCEDCMKCERECPQNGIRVISGVPVFCLHCSPDKAPCMGVCPEGAIEEIEGAIVINEEKCIGCGLCRDACPIGAIYQDEVGIAKKCNLCIDREKPICVTVCPTDALKIDSKSLISDKREKIAKELERIKMIMKY